MASNRNNEQDNVGFPPGWRQEKLKATVKGPPLGISALPWGHLLNHLN